MRFVCHESSSVIHADIVELERVLIDISSTICKCRKKFFRKIKMDENVINVGYFMSRKSERHRSSYIQAACQESIAFQQFQGVPKVIYL